MRKLCAILLTIIFIFSGTCAFAADTANSDTGNNNGTNFFLMVFPEPDDDPSTTSDDPIPSPTPTPPQPGTSWLWGMVKTGDQAEPILWAGIMILSLCAAGGGLWIIKRKDEE